MKKYLIRLADHLDKKGLHKEADYLDWVLRKTALPEDYDPSSIMPQSEGKSLSEADQIRNGQYKYIGMKFITGGGNKGLSLSGSNDFERLIMKMWNKYAMNDTNIKDGRKSVFDRNGFPNSINVGLNSFNSSNTATIYVHNREGELTIGLSIDGTDFTEPIGSQQVFEFNELISKFWEKNKVSAAAKILK